LTTALPPDISSLLEPAAKALPQADTMSKAGGVIWMTGLSGAGKSTLAAALHDRLERSGCLSIVLDGDVLRTGLNQDLGFSPQDRLENIRRTAEVAGLFKSAGFLVLCALISPSARSRELARTIIGERFFEVHVGTELHVCEARDPKGLYRKARRGELHAFTGVSAPYETPSSADLTIDTARDNLATAVRQLESFARQHIRMTQIA